MDIRVGDRIKYLNDVGGGKVITIRDKKIAVVLQDDGFEVPVLLKECIKVAAPEPTSKPRHATPEAKSPKETYNYSEINSPEGDQLDLLFAFMPSDTNSMDYADLDLYLINDSNYFCQYSCGTLKNNMALLLEHGVIEPNTKVLIETFEKRQLLEFKEIWFNGQFFKVDKPFEKKGIIEFGINLKPEKFEANRFKDTDYFKEKAAIFPIIENDFYKSLKSLNNNDLEQAKIEKNPQRARIVKKPEDKNAILEVDLHINALIDNVSGLSNGDILNYQMSKFRETMETYKGQKGKKIVFIHGIGNGTLKTELRKELDRNKMRHQDASFREYGYGATMIII